MITLGSVGSGGIRVNFLPTFDCQSGLIDTDRSPNWGSLLHSRFVHDVRLRNESNIDVCDGRRIVR